MDNLNGMMEKILDIQHPQRVKERLQEKNIRSNSLTVHKVPALSSVSLLDTSVEKQNDNGFFGLDEEGKFRRDKCCRGLCS